MHKRLEALTLASKCLLGIVISNFRRHHTEFYEEIGILHGCQYFYHFRPEALCTREAISLFTAFRHSMCRIIGRARILARLHVVKHLLGSNCVGDLSLG
jgi:hypothetical protein